MSLAHVVDNITDLLAAQYNELLDALKLATPGGRLTLTSGAPVTTADVAASTDVYYTPYLHNIIALWDGTIWQPVTFAEKTLALGAVTSGLPYDVFGYLSGGDLALEKLAWASTTARATAISMQDGRYCKTGDKTRLYLGTFHTISTTQTCDTAAKRFLWNMYNRVVKPLSYLAGEQNWTYGTATWRQKNADAAAKVEIVLGVKEDLLDLTLVTSCTSSADNIYGAAALSEDVTNAPHANCHYQGGGGAKTGTGWFPFASTLRTYPQAGGYHYYAWVEYATAATITFWGGTGANFYRAGIHGSWRC